MTRPKHVGRRLGFGDDPHRTAADVQRFARWVFLQIVARVEPHVLASLADVPGEDDPEQAALDAWAARWHLGDAWCLSHAASTWRAWRRYPASPRVWHDRDDLAGTFVDDSMPPAPRPLKDGRHVEWLARFQVNGQTVATIAETDGTSTPVVHEAIRRAAAVVGLSLRPATRGRPRRPIS